MTNGDYVFLFFNDTINRQPWTTFDMTGQNVDYRKQAFYAVKQVRAFIHIRVGSVTSLYVF